MGKKNRYQKPQTSIYQLENLFPVNQSGHPFEGPLQASDKYLVEGDLHNYVIVSVSPEMTNSSVQELSTQLSEKLGKDIIVVTHNVHFLKASKLSFKDAVKINKRLEKRREQTIKDSDKGTDTPDENSEVEKDEMGRTPAKTFGNGSGPRVRDTGGSGTRTAESRPTTESASSEGDPDKESRQETQVKSEGDE